MKPLSSWRICPTTTSIKTLLLFLFASFQVLLVDAQSSFNIEGRVLNEKGEALKSGFLAHHVFSSAFYESMQATQLSIDPRPVRFDTIVNIVDSAFVSLKFSNGLYVNYDPGKASKIKSDTNPEAENIFLNYGGTLLKLYLNEALIDEKGSLGHYNTFFIEGFWGEKRLGDQLPFEYNPDL